MRLPGKMNPFWKAFGRHAPPIKGARACLNQPSLNYGVLWFQMVRASSRLRHSEVCGRTEHFLLRQVTSTVHRSEDHSLKTG